ncbi:MAG: A/G-specific adenine glycosylase, partial [Bacteroidales bacterium]|nr:A/G-specific adenine glycosylase [Candidatus Colimorpha onthohippi]
GRDYYERFISAFPTVSQLAAASEQDVLKLWQGLGYYSRARNLHTAARQVVNNFGGRFPDTYQSIRSLKGVGRYTAAAIASFAFRLPYPVVDGNVYRFAARYFGIVTPIGTDAAYTEFERYLIRVIDYDRPDLFNHAMMDFGSLHCRPVNPDCTICPFASSCQAYKSGRVALLPIRPVPIKVRSRYLIYIDVRWLDDGNEYLLVHQRSGKDIWKGLYELPVVEINNLPDDNQAVNISAQWIENQCHQKPTKIWLVKRCKHKLTHQTLHVVFIRSQLIQEPLCQSDSCRSILWQDIKNIPVPRLIDSYLNNC